MKFIRILTALFTTALLAFSSTSAHAWATEKEALTLLNEAVADVQAKGKDAALKEFNDPKGKFVKGELYVFAFDMEGNYIANGQNPSLVGKPARNIVDVAGNPVVATMLDIAKNKGEGEVEYMWLNPKVNKLQRKMSHIKVVDGVIVGVGHYFPN